MSILIVGLVVVILVFAGVKWLDATRLARRKVTLELRFSESVREELTEDFKIYGRLPTKFRDDLDGLVHLFIEEKGFEACGGLEEVTDHMKRVIAAQACLLIVNRPHDFFRNLRTILVYPDAFGFDERGVRLGESWSNGTVILSWNAVVSGGRNDKDGHDVSLHEFAHQLDQANTSADGLPFLNTANCYRVWGRTFSEAFDKFCKRIDANKKTVIDGYGATNPAEFFAVCTETFFEKPKQLKKKYPELYGVLVDYYRLDPYEW